MAHGGWPTGVTVRPRLLIVYGGRDGEMAWHSLVAEASGTPKDATLFAVSSFPLPVSRFPRGARRLRVCLCLPAAGDSPDYNDSDRDRDRRTDRRTDGEAYVYCQQSRKKERTKRNSGRERDDASERKREAGEKGKERKREGAKTTKRDERPWAHRLFGHLRHIPPRLALHQGNGGREPWEKERTGTNREEKTRLRGKKAGTRQQGEIQGAWFSGGHRPPTHRAAVTK